MKQDFAVLKILSELGLKDDLLTEQEEKLYESVVNPDSDSVVLEKIQKLFSKSVKAK